MNFSQITPLAVLTILWLSPIADAATETLAKPAISIAEICNEISAQATQNGIPENFFARLIWKESLLNPAAVSPKGAKGIAQFMPGTAKLRGLADPLEPKQALAASALYLAELRRAYGNLGLAAAAYNAGEERTRRWLAGTEVLPLETQDYVVAITGHGHEEWKDAKVEFTTPALRQSGELAARCNNLEVDEAGPRMAALTPLPLAVSGPVATRASAASAAAPRPKWKRWGVTLSAGFSETRALAAFQTISRRYAALKDEKPIVLRKKDLSRGRRKIVRVVIGRDSRAEAESLCSRLSAQGAACFVEKN